MSTEIKVTIRKLKESDRDQLIQLLREFWLDYNRGEMLSKKLLKFEELGDLETRLNDEFLGYLGWITYVAEVDNEVTGFIVGHIKEKPT